MTIIPKSYRVKFNYSSPTHGFIKSGFYSADLLGNDLIQELTEKNILILAEYTEVPEVEEKPLPLKTYSSSRKKRRVLTENDY